MIPNLGKIIIKKQPNSLYPPPFFFIHLYDFPLLTKKQAVKGKYFRGLNKKKSYGIRHRGERGSARFFKLFQPPFKYYYYDKMQESKLYHSIKIFLQLIIKNNSFLGLILSHFVQIKEKTPFFFIYFCMTSHCFYFFFQSA